MGNKTTNFVNEQIGSNENLLLASAALPPVYDGHIPQNLHHHVFDSQSLFPALSEYEKIEITSGISWENLSFTKPALATLKIVDTGGSFKNVMGYYSIDSTGTIRDVSIAFNNTRAAESGLTHSFNIGSKGASINFFMVANGYSFNKEFTDIDNQDGSFSFVHNKGEENERLAKITDSAEDITLIYKAGNGEISTIRGPIYHSTESDDGSQINTDGNLHVVSGIVEDDSTSVLRIGFEDFPGLGDADYNDVIFDLSVSYLNPDSPDIQIPLSDIAPASGNETSLDTKENNGEDYPMLNESWQFNSNYDDKISPDFIGMDSIKFENFLADQIKNFVPNLYVQANEDLHELFGDVVYDNYNQILSEYIQQNFESLYDEIKNDFDALNIQETFTENEHFFNPVTSLDFSYDNVISHSSHIDEMITNFLRLDNPSNPPADSNTPDQSEGLNVAGLETSSFVDAELPQYVETIV